MLFIKNKIKRAYLLHSSVTHQALKVTPSQNIQSTRKSNNLKLFQVFQDLFTFYFLFTQHMIHKKLEEFMDHSLHSYLKQLWCLLTGEAIQLEELAFGKQGYVIKHSFAFT
jgi:hypothetical protein